MLRRRREHARAGVATVGVAALALVVVEILTKTLADFHPRPVVHALITLTAGTLGLAVDRLRAVVALAQARRERDEMLDDDLALWPLPSLTEADPYFLGVFPVSARGPGSVALGPYVPRDADREIAAALRVEPLVVVFGPPRAGKSRTTLEAARRALPEARAIVPEGPDELLRLMDIDPPLDCHPHSAVIWLDGLDRFVTALDLDLLDAVGGRDDLKMVATIREDEYHRIVEAGGQEGEAGRRIITRARGIRLSGELTDREREDARRLLGDRAADGPLGGEISDIWREGHAPVERPRGQSSVDILVPPRKRRTKPGIDVSHRRWEFDPWLAIGAALFVALATWTGVEAGNKFSEDQVTAADQLKDIQRKAHASSITRREVFLQGLKEPSHLLVFHYKGARSDRIEIYDPAGDKVKLGFRYQPITKRGTPLTFFVRNRTLDVDRDGQSDIVGVLRPKSGSFPEDLPILLYWDSTAARYRLTGVLAQAPNLPSLASASSPSDRAQRRRYEKPVEIKDAVGRNELGNPPGTVTAYRVADFELLRSPLDNRVKLIAGYFRAKPTSFYRADAMDVRAWQLGGEAAPRHGVVCTPANDAGKPVAPLMFSTRPGSLGIRGQLLRVWKPFDSTAFCRGAA